MTNVGKWAVYEDPHCYEHYIGIIVMEADGIVAGRDEDDIPWACETKGILGVTESREAAERAIRALDGDAAIDIDGDPGVIAAEAALEAAKAAARAAADAVEEAADAARRRAIADMLANSTEAA